MTTAERDELARQISYALSGKDLGRVSTDGATFQPNDDVIDSACNEAADAILAAGYRRPQASGVGRPLADADMQYIDGARKKQAEVMAECECYDIARTDQEIVIGKLLGFIDALLSSFPALQDHEGAAARGWMPIETAPKDGRDILGFVPSDIFPEGKVVILSWREDDNVHEFAWLDHSYDDFSTGWASTPYDPTHWMPLPAPPSPQSPGDEGGPFTCMYCTSTTCNDDNICDVCRISTAPRGVEP